MAKNRKEGCVLMFSGGRDSTIAAVRLSGVFDRLVLVTVLSEHLVGIERVRRRMQELDGILPRGSEWLQVIQPALPIEETLVVPTCLPCQRAYVAVGVTIARRRGISDLAMGYSGYQNTWPEQTPYATKRLRALLEEVGIHLHLPVYDIESKRAACDELERLGLAPEAREQKCLRQSDNVDIEGELLRAEVDRWIEGLSAVIRSETPLSLDIVPASGQEC